MAAAKAKTKRTKAKPKPASRRKGLSGAEIAVLSLLGGAVLAVAAFLVFPKLRDSFSSGPVPWTLRGRYAEGRISRPRDMVLAGRRAFTLDLGNFKIIPVDLDAGAVREAWPRSEGLRFNEPFGLALRPQGGLAVADTFYERKNGRGRVVLLNAEGRLDASLEGDFFGPRDLCLGPEGKIYLSDTGNHRILTLDPKGQLLDETGSRGGGRGEFDEPRSLALDKGGLLYVLDMRNRRWVQMTPDGNFLKTGRCRCLNPEGDVPYMALSAGGRIAVSCPGASQIQIFTSAGKSLATLDFQGQIQPYGLAFVDESTLLIADEACQGLSLVGFSGQD